LSLTFGSVTVAAISALVVMSLQIVVQARLSLGLDGADQMQFLIWLGVALSGASLVAGLTLIAGQSLLSYLVAGWAKVGGKVWRAGQAPSAIVATIGHGNPRAHHAVSALTLPIAYGTMAFETLGPVLAFLGGFFLLCFVVTALGFHVGIAWAMGLNNFVWAFTAALPAVVWLVTSVTGRGMGL